MAGVSKQSTPGNDNQSEERRGQTNERRRFELVVAIIASSSALLGSLVGGLVGYMQTKEQVAGSAEVARDTYLRAERRTSYAAMEQAADIANEWSDTIYFSLLGGDVPSRAFLKRKVQQRAAVEAGLDEAFDTLALVASRPVFEAADNFQVQHLMADQRLLGLLRECVRSRGKECPNEDDLAVANADERTANTDMFLEMREDLGVGR